MLPRWSSVCLRAAAWVPAPFTPKASRAGLPIYRDSKVVYPASPADAKGLLMTAIADPNPVLFFEHKLLYRTLKGPVPGGVYYLPLGKARIVRPGQALSIISYGLGVHWALEVAERYDAEVIDLRSLLPWDRETVYASVQKTSRVLVLYEATQTGAFGAEVAAAIAEDCFAYLDAPVRRLGSLDTPVPFHPELETAFMGKARLRAVLDELIAW